MADFGRSVHCQSVSRLVQRVTCSRARVPRLRLGGVLKKSESSQAKLTPPSATTREAGAGRDRERTEAHMWWLTRSSQKLQYLARGKRCVVSVPSARRSATSLALVKAGQSSARSVGVPCAARWRHMVPIARDRLTCRVGGRAVGALHESRDGVKSSQVKFSQVKSRARPLEVRCAALKISSRSSARVKSSQVGSPPKISSRAACPSQVKQVPESTQVTSPLKRSSRSSARGQRGAQIHGTHPTAWRADRVGAPAHARARAQDEISTALRVPGSSHCVET
jgi:hypothetical protein